MKSLFGLYNLPLVISFKLLLFDSHFGKTWLAGPVDSIFSSTSSL